MKKFIALLSAIILCFSLCACRNNESNLANEIELTNKNINDYLVVNVSFSDREQMPLLATYSTATVTIDIYPIAGKSFNNVELVVDFDLKSKYESWSIDPNDDSYKYIEELSESLQHSFITQIKLPADGKYTGTYTIRGLSIDYLPENKTITRWAQQFSGRNMIYPVMASSALPENTPFVKGTVTI